MLRTLHVMQMSVYGVEGVVHWGVRLAVFASIDLSGLFPDAIAQVLDKAGVDLQTSFDAGIRILSNSKGGATFAFEFDGDIHEHHFECLDDEDCDAEAERNGTQLYCNTPAAAGTNWGLDDILTCRGKKDNGEFCTSDSSCLNGDCSGLRCGGLF